MEPTAISQPSGTTPMIVDAVVREEAPFPISAIAMPPDIAMMGTPGGGGAGPVHLPDEGSDAAEEEGGLFGGGDDEEEESDAMEEVQTASHGTNGNGAERKLVEDEDYD
jgi:transcription initiation factor TFIID subunit 9B